MSDQMSDGDPSASQTAQMITAYYREAKVGDAACIRMTYGGMLEFKMSVIEKAATKSRIALRDAYPFGGYGFYVDGRNCKSPGGQGRLVVPTQEIEGWISRHPTGSLHWR
jgi:hypothetical protein